MTQTRAKHFIEQRIEADKAAGTYPSIITRFPPEPSGYLHLGHAKAICLNFAMADQYQGRCHLRFDDTNPAKEALEFSESIKQDISWLGFKWDELFYASDYFEQLYQFAMTLIKAGKAYVCSLNGEQIRQYRGTLTEPGQNSPYRERSVEENIDLFQRMRQDEFADGSHVLRAKIDMAASNINLRDPVIYRILHANHPHVDTNWCIYPMYDFAHALSDGIEHISHSLCSLEFQDHRPLYDWFLAQLLPEPRPQQIEFSRLNVSHTITSKRKLKLLVDNAYVTGWDDPRMPTLAGMRRRGFTPHAIRQFCADVGISKNDSIIDMGLLEERVRDDLNQHAMRAVCVLNPIKVVIKNLDPLHQQTLTVPNHPQRDELGTRQLSFSDTLYIDRDDFMENPPSKYHRLSPGKEVRLRHCYVIKCEEVIKDDDGHILELHCSYDPNTLGKKPEGRKVKGVIHWLDANNCQPCTVNLYDRLFNTENPASAEGDDAFLQRINPHSLQQLHTALVEKSLSQHEVGTAFQFERVGLF